MNVIIKLLTVVILGSSSGANAIETDKLEKDLRNIGVVNPNKTVEYMKSVLNHSVHKLTKYKRCLLHIKSHNIKGVDITYLVQSGDFYEKVVTDLLPENVLIALGMNMAQRYSQTEDLSELTRECKALSKLRPNNFLTFKEYR